MCQFPFPFAISMYVYAFNKHFTGLRDVEAVMDAMIYRACLGL